MRHSQSVVLRPVDLVKETGVVIGFCLLAGSCATLLVGCDRQDQVREQSEARASLRSEQAGERAAMRQKQIDQQAGLRNEQQEDTQDQAREQEADRAKAETELAEAHEAALKRIQTACEGVPAALVAQCPVDPSWVASSRRTEGGVSITLRPAAGTNDEIEKHVACYQARSEARVNVNTSPTITMPDDARSDVSPVSCLLDLPGVKPNVAEIGKRTIVELEVAEEDVPALWAWTRKLTARRVVAKP
jgi:hypothetical protein